MTALGYLWPALRLAGRPWTVWAVGIVLTIANQGRGVAGFDAIGLAVGPTILWAIVSYGCRLLTGLTGNPWRRSILPTNAPLPKAKRALIVVEPCPPEASPSVAQMVERLPEHLRHLIR